MTVYFEGVIMKKQNDAERKDGKRAWSAPKVERRAMIDRTQSGGFVYSIESGSYRPS
jgi:hypothetical protein